jgi:hypothetical protein
MDLPGLLHGYKDEVAIRKASSKRRQDPNSQGGDAYLSSDEALLAKYYSLSLEHRKRLDQFLHPEFTIKGVTTVASEIEGTVSKIFFSDYDLFSLLRPKIRDIGDLLRILYKLAPPFWSRIDVTEDVFPRLYLPFSDIGTALNHIEVSSQ